MELFKKESKFSFKFDETLTTNTLSFLFDMKAHTNEKKRRNFAKFDLDKNKMYLDTNFNQSRLRSFVRADVCMLIAMETQ